VVALICVKATNERATLNDPMLNVAPSNREAKALRKLAAWYRSWADVAGNADEKRRRVALAEYLERQARKRDNANIPRLSP
jgi:hypothetical protein